MHLDGAGNHVRGQGSLQLASQGDGVELGGAGDVTDEVRLVMTVGDGDGGLTDVG
ncbi:hypothetical protein GCM10027418_10530 [Mariniluteicoccus endophyticus]